jgi:predicted TIM-barrel fold metal-dependent hydrolase
VDLPLVDHHCHGVLREPVDRATFEANLTEAAGPGPWHRTLADTQAGLAVRAICAPLLDLPAHAPIDDYLARRGELGVDEVNRRLLGATGIDHFLVDTGLTPETITTPAQLAGYVAGTGHEIVRMEAVAESVVADVAADAYVDAVAAALADRVAGAVGVKSIAAYRGGLDLDPARPTAAEVTAAAASWQASLTGARPRLTDRVLIRHLIWTALDLGKPIQFHIGYGDADVDLHRCRPTLLTPLLRATTGLGVPIMLLHNYPFHREAGYLAQVFDHVFVDVGLALQNVGSRADTVLAELLELAPFAAVLFSTDAYALPELFAVHAALFRRALRRFLDDGLQRDHWSAVDAERVAGMIASGNARRAYGLDAP